MTHLIVAASIGLPLYVLFCLLKPSKACRRCGGWGSKASRRRSARRQCRSCDGTGKRFRVPARLVYRIRGAMRRHAELTFRAAQRAAEAEADRAGQEREQVRP